MRVTERGPPRVQSPLPRWGRVIGLASIAFGAGAGDPVARPFGDVAQGHAAPGGGLAQHQGGAGGRVELGGVVGFVDGEAVALKLSEFCGKPEELLHAY